MLHFFSFKVVLSGFLGAAHVIVEAREMVSKAQLLRLS